MGGWIKFKGITSTEMGCKIESMPADAAPKSRLDPVKIPGRSGVLHTDDDSYDPVTLTAVLNLAGRSNERAITAWLNGWGDLVLSDSPQYRRKAVVNNGVTFKRRRLKNGEAYDSLTVKFECDPYLYEVNPQVDTYLSPRTYCTMDNPGTEPAEPLIVVRGSGQVRITVGDVTVTLDNLSGEVAIDCDAKTAYKGSEDNFVSITLDDKEWPVLGLGATRVSWTGNVQRMEITPNWRWL